MLLEFYLTQVGTNVSFAMMAVSPEIYTNWLNAWFI
jgi:hypothetical protein